MCGMCEGPLRVLRILVNNVANRESKLSFVFLLEVFMNSGRKLLSTSSAAAAFCLPREVMLKAVGHVNGYFYYKSVLSLCVQPATSTNYAAFSRCPVARFRALRAHYL